MTSTQSLFHNDFVGFKSPKFLIPTHRKGPKGELKMDSFESQSFPSLAELLRPLALHPYDAGVVLGVVDTMAMLAMRKMFTEHSGLQQTARDFLNDGIEQNSITAGIADRIGTDELVAVVGGVIVATYGYPPALDSRTFSLAVAELEANISTKLFQIAWQIVQLDTVEETRLFSAGFTALHPGEVLGRDNALRDVELQATGEPINVSEVTTPCEEPLPEGTVCTICQYEFGAAGAEAEELEEGELSGTGPVKARCEHVFHADCLDQWVNSAMGNSNLCPICRMALCVQRPREPAEPMEGGIMGEVPDSGWDR